LPSKKKRLVIILGPTGVGKSAAGVTLASRFGGEIINCDSMQVYRGFDSEPTSRLRRCAGACPIIFWTSPERPNSSTAADFVREAVAALRAIEERGRLPFVVGGTGLYLKALLDGLFPGPGRNEELRRTLDREAAEKGADRPL